MKPIAIATNELGMHVMVRPVPRQFLSDGALDEVATEDVNALITARRPSSLASAIARPPPAAAAVSRYHRRRKAPVWP